MKEEHENAELAMILKKTKCMCIGGIVEDLDIACDSYNYFAARIESDGWDEKIKCFWRRWEVADKKRLVALEINVLQIASRMSRLEQGSNKSIKTMMNFKESVTDLMEQRQLIWYDHVQRMEEDGVPKITLLWLPPEERNPGSRIRWIENIKRAISLIKLENEG